MARSLSIGFRERCASGPFTHASAHVNSETKANHRNLLRAPIFSPLRVEQLILSPDPVRQHLRQQVLRADPEGVNRQFRTARTKHSPSQSADCKNTPQTGAFM